MVKDYLLVAAEQFLLVEKMLKKTLVIALLTLLSAVDYAPPDVFDGVQVACFLGQGRRTISCYSANHARTILAVRMEQLS